MTDAGCPNALFAGESGLSQRRMTLILLQKYRDTNGRRILIQIGGVKKYFCQEGGIPLQKYRDRNGRCIAILFESIGVRGRRVSPERNYFSAGCAEGWLRTIEGTWFLDAMKGVFSANSWGIFFKFSTALRGIHPNCLHRYFSQAKFALKSKLATVPCSPPDNISPCYFQGFSFLYVSMVCCIK